MSQSNSQSILHKPSPKATKFTSESYSNKFSTDHIARFNDNLNSQLHSPINNNININDIQNLSSNKEISKEKHVIIGNIGATPKKEHIYNMNDPPISIVSKSSTDSYDRPKTSRKVPQPSPEQYVDYLSASNRSRKKDINKPLVLPVHKDKNNENSNVNNNNNNTSNSKSSENNNNKDSKDDKKSDLDYDSVIRLGCWLFGVGLKSSS